jgi:hypothetical protein
MLHPFVVINRLSFLCREVEIFVVTHSLSRVVTTQYDIFDVNTGKVNVKII